MKRLEQLRLVEVRHGDAMRVADWRTAGGLDVLAHLLFRAGGLDTSTLDCADGGARADALRVRAPGRRPAQRRPGAARSHDTADADRGRARRRRRPGARLGLLRHRRRGRRQPRPRARDELDPARLLRARGPVRERWSTATRSSRRSTRTPRGDRSPRRTAAATAVRALADAQAARLLDAAGGATTRDRRARRRSSPAFADTVVAPEPVLPPVETTDAVAFFDDWLTLAPASSTRTGLRALLVATRARARSRSASAAACAASPRTTAARYLRELERKPSPPAAASSSKPSRGSPSSATTATTTLMRRLGYDADANVAPRARAARRGGPAVTRRPTGAAAYTDGTAIPTPGRGAHRGRRGRSPASARSRADACVIGTGAGGARGRQGAGRGRHDAW